MFGNRLTVHRRRTRVASGMPRGNRSLTFAGRSAGGDVGGANEGRRPCSRMPNFPNSDSAALAGACRKGARRRLASRKRWFPVPTTASASSRSATVRVTQSRCRARANRSAAPWIVSSASTIPIPPAPKPAGAGGHRPGRHRPVAGLRGRAERVRLRPARERRKRWRSRCDNVPLNRIQLRHRRASGEPRHAPTGWWRFLSKRRVRPGQAQPVLRHRSGGDLCRHRPAAHVDRGAAGVDAAIAGAFLRARRARRPAGGDGRVFHNAGATEAQELGIVIASAVSHLRMFEEARQALVYAAPHIGFSLSVDQDQFVSMAKVRALRRLWARVAGGLLDPAAAGHDPCRDVLPDDDGDGPGDQHPAHHDRRFCGGSRRRRFDLDPAAHDRARPAGRLCPPRSPATRS